MALYTFEILITGYKSDPACQFNKIFHLLMDSLLMEKRLVYVYFLIFLPAVF